MPQAEAACPGDADLLAAVGRDGSRAAMDELVRRYVDFVYAAATRRLGDRHAAEDVTQTVFLVLARKAAVVQAGALPTWLHRTTQYVCANAERAARRRRRHEQRAARAEAVMPDAPNEPDPLLPLLDRAIDSLGTQDRTAVVERYLLGRDYAAVGATLGLSAGSAQKRVERAVDKLRRRFTRAGVPAAAVAVMAALAAAAPSSATAAPLAVASAVTQFALAGAAPPSAAALTKGLFIMTAGTKVKLAAAAVVVLLLGGGVGTVLLSPAAPSPAPIMATAPTSARSPEAAAQPAGLIAMLSDGTTIEVAALGDQERDEWWGVDGRPVERPISARAGRRTRAAPAGKRWVWVVWRIERPGASVIDVVANAVPPVNSSGSTPFVDAQGRPYSAYLVAVDADRTTLAWRVSTCSKPAQHVVLDRPASGTWAADTAITQAVPGVGQISIRNPRELQFAPGPNGFGAAFDCEVPRVGGSRGWGMTLADASGRTNWNSTADLPTNSDTLHTRAASVPLKDVARVTVDLRSYDEGADFTDLPLHPGGTPSPRVTTHEPPEAVAAGAKLAPFTDLRFAGDVPQVLVGESWWEWITLDGRPVADVIADAKRLDERQWQKRLGEDLVDVLQAGGFTVGPTVKLGLRTLDGTGTSTTDVPMTAENRRLVRERRAARERDTQ